MRIVGAGWSGRDRGGYRCRDRFRTGVCLGFRIGDACGGNEGWDLTPAGDAFVAEAELAIG